MSFDSFAFGDELGPEKVLHLRGPMPGLEAVVVVDNTACGPAIGGIRMAPDVTVQECFRLARAMTLKNAAAALPYGGGKAVIVADPAMPETSKERLIRSFAQAIRDLSCYIPGPDMGTDERCMGWIKDEIGRVVGLPSEVGGIPLDQIGATGLGVAVACEVACKQIGVVLEGARVCIQGFGAVGSHAARFLSARGARIVAVSDSAGCIMDEAGLDVASLIALKAAARSVNEHRSGRAADREAVIEVPCDIWIPAARPDVIHVGNVERIQTRMIVSGANIPITADAERRLHERGVLLVPDFIANAGGVICAAVEYRGGDQSTAMATIEQKVRVNTQLVLQRATTASMTTRRAAEELARERIVAAMSLRRWR